MHSLSPARQRGFTLPQLILFMSAMGTGGALVVTILTGLPLSFSLLLFVVFGITAAIFVWMRTDPLQRQELVLRSTTGLLAGAAATLLYDLWRLLLVVALKLSYWPFETFVLFGRSIAGADLSVTQAYAVGIVYHCVNGLLFAVAYALLLGGARWYFGIVFALVLEAVVIVLYPGWLDLRAVMAEFTAVSLSGHTAYGLVLGQVCERRLRGRTRAGFQTRALPSETAGPTAAASSPGDKS